MTQERDAAAWTKVLTMGKVDVTMGKGGKGNISRGKTAFGVVGRTVSAW